MTIGRDDDQLEVGNAVAVHIALDHLMAMLLAELGPQLLFSAAEAIALDEGEGVVFSSASDGVDLREIDEVGEFEVLDAFAAVAFKSRHG